MSIRFFDEMYMDDEIRRTATIEGKEIRILVGKVDSVYASAMGVSLVNNSREIILVKDEIPKAWRYDRPGAKMTIGDRAYQTHQELPPQETSDGELLRLTVHPV